MIRYNWSKEISESFGSIMRPVAEIHIKDKNKIWRAVTMYVDSGADVSIIKRSFGELFGHKIKKGKKIRLKGIGSEIAAYIHKMDLLIGKHEIPLDVAIADTDNIPNLLGRKTLFDLFEIRFKNLKKQTHFSKTA